MAHPLVAANWKMNTTLTEAEALVRAEMAELGALDGLDVVLCPPFVSLGRVAGLVKGTRLHVGAQNLHWENEGAFTGEVSADMLRHLCKYVIVGHSERRQLFGETDEMVSRKVKAALAADLIPILCVGEVLEEREQGRAIEVVTTQVRAALEGVASTDRVVVAYEPVWAIGTGLAADGAAAEEMCGLARQLVAEAQGEGAAKYTPILYGGSVNPDNISQYVGQPNVDGALVGGASLKPDQFVAIARATAEARVA
ncbi:MAG: triosephosphate isomerase (TIM) [Chloroflexi bacterium]|jgi:triosephosphate isomerase|nr:MAG: triosephosphate isomerase (TIM) [Chloroflexota bacterium]